MHCVGECAERERERGRERERERLKLNGTHQLLVYAVMLVYFVSTITRNVKALLVTKVLVWK